MKNLILALAVLLFVAPASAAGPERESPQTCCHSCGVELLPQTGDVVYDKEGNGYCGPCGSKLGLVPEKGRAYDILTAKKLTGDWGQVRTDLENVGVKYSPLFIGHYQFNFRGGVNTHNAHESTGRLFHNLEFDFEKMFGLKGATFFARINQSWNDGINRHVGARVPPYWGSGSPGDKSQDLDKWWWRQRLFDNRLEFRLGKLVNIIDLIDQNVYAKAYSVTFMNRAFSHNLTVPTTKGLGAFAKWWPVDWLYVEALAVDPDYGQTTCSHGWGGFDTAFGGEDRFRAFWEFGLLPNKIPGGESLLPGHYRFGWWLDPQAKAKFIDDLGGLRAEQRRGGDVGWYLSFDQMVWKENNDPKDKQGLGLFARYGFAHQDVNRVNHFWSAGASYQGLIPSRDKDVLGFGVAQSILSKTYRHNIDSRADRETVYELYYSIKVTPWCEIAPDVQVVTNPGGGKDARDALIGGVRVKIVF